MESCNAWQESYALLNRGTFSINSSGIKWIYFFLCISTYSPGANVVSPFGPRLLRLTYSVQWPAVVLQYLIHCAKWQQLYRLTLNFSIAIYSNSHFSQCYIFLPLLLLSVSLWKMSPHKWTKSVGMVRMDFMLLLRTLQVTLFRLVRSRNKAQPWEILYIWDLNRGLHALNAL